MQQTYIDDWLRRQQRLIDDVGHRKRNVLPQTTTNTDRQQMHRSAKQS
jgi:hypothetical protein